MFIDMEKMSAFDGLISFNIFILILDIVILLQFAWSWYIDYRKTGWKLNVWHYSILIHFIVPFCLLYPFCSSEWNIFSTGDAYIKISRYVEQAFAITMLGYLFILFGKRFASIDSKKYDKFNFFEKILYTNITYGFGIHIVMLMCILFFLVAAILSAGSGQLFNGRGWFLTHPTYRFIGNAFTSIFSVAFLYMGLRFLNGYRSKIDILLIVLVFPTVALWGSRGLLFGGILSIIIYWMFLHKDFSMKKIILIGIVFLPFLMIMSILRSGADSSESGGILATILMNLFYGNSFSDCRDFAWILSGFNDDMYQLGKTYLSGLTSFLPSGVFPFRREYAIGPLTLDLAGLVNTDGEHPGLRGGMFYEIYLNFSILGVMIYGLIYGYILRKVDLWTRYYVDVHRNVILSYIKNFPLMLIGWFSVTAGMFSMYMFFALQCICLLLNIFPVFLNSQYKK